MAITSLQDQFDLARNGALKSRIEAALMRVSRGVRVETPERPFASRRDAKGGMSETRAAKRQDLALAVRAQVQAFVERFAREAADNEWIQANVVRNKDGSWDLEALTDEALVREVAASWDEQAGVLPSELP